MPEMVSVEFDLGWVRQVHGRDASDRAMTRKKSEHDQMLGSFNGVPRCFVAMAAFGGSHF